MKNATFSLQEGKQEKNMQSKLDRNIILENYKKDSEKGRNFLNPESVLIGIELVRFDDQDNEESSTKVSIAPFLAPCDQSNPIFG